MNPERALVMYINNSRKNVYGAFYKVSSQAIARALIRAHNRGIKIRIVTETGNSSTRAIHLMRKAGIPVVTDNRKGLMHHKFAVIDGKILWTGSYNATSNGAFKNNNNAMAILSPKLAEIYTVEFNEMFKEKIFQNRREQRIFPFLNSRYYVKIQGTPVNVYFSPEDSIERIIINRLKKAKKSVYFLAFSFTSNALGEMMVQLHKRGVKVRGVFEKKGSNSRASEYVKMKLEGIPVRLDTNRYSMHHKVIIIDGTTLITGSYNFTKGANRKNDENILIIQDKGLARLYTDEFRRLYDVKSPY